MRRQKIIIVLGPTAVGKSELAVRLAKKFKGEVVSADSRQVYRGLNIGTGKITKKERHGVRHHLLDVVSPRGQYSVARYVKDATRAIDDIIARGKVPIICGGTGLYIDALLGKISFPNIPPNPKLRRKLTGKTVEELFRILKKISPKRAEAISKNQSERNNRHRLIRAIEIGKYVHTLKIRNCYLYVYEHSSVEIRCQQMLTSDFNGLKIGLRLPPHELRRRIRARLAARMRRGMVAEARQLHKNGLSWKRMESLGLEYRYLAFFLQNRITKEQMIEKLNTEIWRYAKRQTTWFKRNKEIRWFSPDDKTILKAVANIFSL